MRRDCVRYAEGMAEGGRTCRSRGGAPREDLEIEIDEQRVRVRAGRRLVCTLEGHDAATARILAADAPHELERFIASRVAGSRKMPR